MADEADTKQVCCFLSHALSLSVLCFHLFLSFRLNIAFVHESSIEIPSRALYFCDLMTVLRVADIFVTVYFCISDFSG